MVGGERAIVGVVYSGEGEGLLTVDSVGLKRGWGVHLFPSGSEGIGGSGAGDVVQSLDSGFCSLEEDISVGSGHSCLASKGCCCG